LRGALVQRLCQAKGAQTWSRARRVVTPGADRDYHSGAKAAAQIRNRDRGSFVCAPP
jgi:hypothetical protein